LLNPTLNKADAEAVLEAFDGQHFQVGENAVLVMDDGILAVEFHLPDAGQLNVGLRKKLRVGQTGNERPIVQTQVSESARFIRASRRPKCETEGEMISLAKVMACDDGSENHIEQSERAIFFPD